MPIRQGLSKFVIFRTFSVYGWETVYQDTNHSPSSLAALHVPEANTSLSQTSGFSVCCPV